MQFFAFNNGKQTYWFKKYIKSYDLDMFLVHTYMKDTNTRSKHEHVRSHVLYTVYLEKGAYEI